MGHVPYVGFVIYRCATVRTRLCLYIKKKKKKKSVVTSIATLPQAELASRHQVAPIELPISIQVHENM